MFACIGGVVIVVLGAVSVVGLPASIAGLKIVYWGGIGALTGLLGAGIAAGVVKCMCDVSVECSMTCAACNNTIEKFVSAERQLLAFRKSMQLLQDHHSALSSCFRVTLLLAFSSADFDVHHSFCFRLFRTTWSSSLHRATTWCSRTTWTPRRTRSALC